MHGNSKKIDYIILYVQDGCWFSLSDALNQPTLYPMTKIFFFFKQITFCSPFQRTNNSAHCKFLKFTWDSNFIQPPKKKITFYTFPRKAKAFNFRFVLNITIKVLTRSYMDSLSLGIQFLTFCISKCWLWMLYTFDNYLASIAS